MVLHQSTKFDINSSRRKVCQQNNIKHIVKQTQSYMLKLVENLSSYEPFDNTVKPNDCVDRLVVHRIVNKFHIDDPLASAALQASAFSTYIEYDNTLSVNSDNMSTTHLNSARNKLHEWFKDFKVDFADVRYEVSPGETFISSQGEVSILAKLLDRNHWTVTANCLDDACVFIYNNASFKRAAWQHIGVRTRKEKRIEYLKFRHTADIGFNVFRKLLIDRVLIIVDGARASSVPKSTSQRRFINIEAMFSVILQRAAAREILRVLHRRGNSLANYKVRMENDPLGVGYVEHSAQHLHGVMISNSDFSTIDFSNASDSVTIAAVDYLFPKQVSNLLIQLRSHYVAIENEFHSPIKLSSMGNGFTFEVMTAMLYAIASVFSSNTRVYGDDVIIPNDFADDFVSTCKLIDFRVNEKKTFINSFFRESCGYFYSDHINDYITSFDFGQILSLSDVIITCNKLTVIIESGQISPDLLIILMNTRDSISALVHASRKGPLPPGINLRRKFLSTYIFDEDYVKKQRRSKKDLTPLRHHYIEKNATHFANCQINRSEISLVYVPFFVPHRSKLVFTSSKGLDVLLPALYSGKRLKAVLKGKGKWIDLPAFVSCDGTLTLISNLISPQGIWVDRLNGVFMNHERR